MPMCCCPQGEGYVFVHGGDTKADFEAGQLHLTLGAEDVVAPQVVSFTSEKLDRWICCIDQDILLESGALLVGAKFFHYYNLAHLS